MISLNIKGFSGLESVESTSLSERSIPPIAQGLVLAKQAWDNMQQGKPIFEGVRPMTPQQLQVYLNRLQSDEIPSLVIKYTDMMAKNLLNTPVSPATIVATIFACAIRESQLKPNAEAPSTGAKGVLQLLPSTFTNHVKQYETEARYAPLRSFVNDSNLMNDIKKVDRTYFNYVKEFNHAKAHLEEHPVSQVLPSLGFIYFSIQTINRQWGFTPDKGWQPKIKPKYPHKLNTMWNLVPGSQADLDMGFALLYNIYHINGPGLLTSDRFSFHHVERNNYAQRVALTMEFVHDPGLISKHLSV